MRQPTRLHPALTRVVTALATGAGLGFLARDLLGLPAPAAAIAWLLGALIGSFGLGRC
jgi:hypothetical protein